MHGSGEAEMVVRGTTMRLQVIVIDHVVGGIDIVMGMDAINRPGGVSGGDTVSFCCTGTSCAESATREK